MLSGIPKKAITPVGGSASGGELADRVAPAVTGLNLGNVLDLESCIGGAPAKIDIFEPDGVKAFIEATEFVPDVAAEHQECTGRLFDRAGRVERTIEIAVFSIDWVGGPQAIDPKEFEDECGGSGKTANGEAGLGAAFEIDQFSGCETKMAASVDQSVNRSEQVHVRVEKQNKIGTGFSDALIDGGSESAVFGIRYSAYTCVNAVDRTVLGRVVDYDRGDRRRHFSETLQAGLNDLCGIVCNNYRRSRQK